MSYDKQEKALAHRDKMAQELFGFIRRLDQYPPDNLFAFVREQNFQLIEFLLEEERLLAHINGEAVEPRQHNMEVRLVGRFGGRFG